MSYKITIIKLDEVQVTKRDWVRQSDTGNENGGGPVYGYATYDSTTTQETKILEQTVETLEIGKVIRAVNGLA